MLPKAETLTFSHLFIGNLHFFYVAQSALEFGGNCNLLMTKPILTTRSINGCRSPARAVGRTSRVSTLPFSWFCREWFLWYYWKGFWAPSLKKLIGRINALSDKKVHIFNTTREKKIQLQWYYVVWSAPNFSGHFSLLQGENTRPNFCSLYLGRFCLNVHSEWHPHALNNYILFTWMELSCLLDRTSRRSL